MVQDNREFVFGQYKSEPSHLKIKTFSKYLEMRDGVRLAISVIMPADLKMDEKIPAVLYQTRYWREFEGKFPFRWMFRPGKKTMGPYMAARGYAMVRVDVRGTGASFGVWPYPWDEKSIEDAREIVDWVIAQPWSNGRVGGLGGSYTGTTAELLAVLNHPAVRAVIPMYNHPNPYTDISHPGGMFNERFVRYWSMFDLELDHHSVPIKLSKFAPLIRGVKPVDDDRDRAMLASALQEHAHNGDVEKIAENVSFADEIEPTTGHSVQVMTTERFKEKLLTTPTAIFGWASWMDAATADAAIRRYQTLPNARRLAIGPWTHGGVYYASPFDHRKKSFTEDMTLHFNEWLRFLDPYLKGEEADIPVDKVVHYYTLGEETWKQSKIWPPEGTQMQRWFLQPAHGLSITAPVESEGCDRYRADPEVTTGQDNRWWEFISFDHRTVKYNNRREQTRRLLVYQSDPLQQELELAGQPVINLYISANEADCGIFVYLELVEEKGEITYITEGQLRSIHRDISEEEPSYKITVPYHTFKEKDANPLIPGEIAQVSFGLLATSVLFPKGSRIRVSIAGYDKGTFRPIPSKNGLVYTVQRNRIHPSWIDLPVTPRH